MDRRRFLHVSAATTAGLAGCQSLPDSAGDGSTSQTDTDHRETDDPPAGTTDPAFDVSVATSRYLVSAFEQTPIQRAIEPEQIVPVAELSKPLRTALRSARDGTFEIDSVSETVLAGIDRFRHNDGGYRFEPYVEFDGTPYAFEPSVPVFTASLSPVGGETTDTDDTDDAHDPDRTVTDDDLGSLADPVHDFVRTLGAFTVEVARDEYRVSVVPDSVREFLDDYEFVRDPRGVGRIVTERVDPGPPYTIDLRRLTETDIWGRRVIDGESLSAGLRQFLTTAANADCRKPALRPFESEYRTDSLPADYDETLRAESERRDPYVRLGGTVYGFRVHEIERSNIPVAVSVAAVSPDTDSFRVTVEPSAAGERPSLSGPVELEARGALPSLLWLETDTGCVLLPSDNDETIRWEPAETDTEGVERRARNLVREELAPDESLSATYRVPESVAVPTGTYEAWGLFEVSWVDPETGRSTPLVPYPFRVVLSVGASAAANSDD